MEIQSYLKVLSFVHFLIQNGISLIKKQLRERGYFMGVQKFKAILVINPSFN